MADGFAEWLATGPPPAPTEEQVAELEARLRDLASCEEWRPGRPADEPRHTLAWLKQYSAAAGPSNAPD